MQIKTPQTLKGRCIIKEKSCIKNKICFFLKTMHRFLIILAFSKWSRNANLCIFPSELVLVFWTYLGPFFSSSAPKESTFDLCWNYADRILFAVKIYCHQRHIWFLIEIFSSPLLVNIEDWRLQSALLCITSLAVIRYGFLYFRKIFVAKWMSQSPGQFESRLPDYSF